LEKINSIAMSDVNVGKVFVKRYTLPRKNYIPKAGTFYITRLKEIKIKIKINKIKKIM